jgi:hypothetical protein
MIDAFQKSWGLGSCCDGCASGHGGCGDSAPGMGFLYAPTTGPLELPWWDPWGQSGGGLEFPTFDWWIPGPMTPIYTPDSCGRLVGDREYGQDCQALPSPCGVDARGFQIAPVLIKDASGAITGIRCPDLGTGGALICNNVCPGGYVRESLTSCNCIPNPSQPQQPNRTISGAGGQTGSGGTSTSRGASSGSGAGATPQQQCATVGKVYNASTNRCDLPSQGTTIQSLCQQTGLQYDPQLGICFRPEITNQGVATYLPWALGALALMMVMK